MRRAAARSSSSSTPAISAKRATSIVPRWATTSASPVAWSASQSSARSCSWTSTAQMAARHQASVPGLTWRWMSASSADLGAPRVDDDQGALRVSRDLLERRTGAREPMGLPRVLPEEDAHLGMLEVAAREPAEQLGVDPELAGLLLGQRARPVAGPQRCHAWPSSTGRRGGSPARRRRSRRSIPRRGRRAPRRSGRRPRRWRCPSRSPRRSRRHAGASAPSGGDDRSGSGRGAAPSRTCSPATRDGPCRRGCARSGGRRRRPAAPRSRSCIRTRCRPCSATQLST